MGSCIDCKSEVSDDAKFCPNCGTQMGVTKDVYKVAGGGLIGKVKEILNDAKVKRIVVKDDKGKVLLSIPVTWGCGRCNNGGISTMAGCARSYRRNSHPVYYRG